MDSSPGFCTRNAILYFDFASRNRYNGDILRLYRFVYL